MTYKQMIINYAPGEECRVAVVEDGRLEEFHSERAGAISFVGNIYVGRVTNVEPSIQAAFVDFGLESNGFLHVSDIHPMHFPGGDDKTELIGKKTPRRERPPIQACLRKGQEIVVQVLKEGINTKGPTLTSYISIPGRYLVMLPDMDRVGVSRKVEDDELRREMRKVLDTLALPEGFGFILRTAGEGRGKMELKRDLAYLMRLWKDIERRRKGGDRPRLLYAESDLLMRALRDFWTADINEIVIDSESALRRAARFMKIVSPRSSTKLLHYNRTMPLFHAFGIEEQILRTHAREVPLPSGGSLVIDETEAMIAIDVNSGKSRSHGDAETTAYRTNIEAVDEICRQIRLRDVGGLVLCDLIDMMSRSHRREIENLFKERLKRDRAASKTLPISQFGIVEMTRQRQKQSLRNTHYAKCPECSGRGLLKRPDSVSDDAIRDLAALLEHDKVAKVELVVSPRVAGELLSHRRQTLGRLEFTLRKHVDVRVSEDIPGDRVVFYAYDAAGADIDTQRLPMPKSPRDLPEWAIPSVPGDEDWAVDTAQEETAGGVAMYAGAEEHEGGDSFDLLLEEDHDQPAQADTPVDSARTQSPDPASAGREGEQPAGGRRKRRRRRRGSGAGRGEGMDRANGEVAAVGSEGAGEDPPPTPDSEETVYDSMDSAEDGSREDRAPLSPASQRPAPIPRQSDGADRGELFDDSLTPSAKRRRRRRRRGGGGGAGGGAGGGGDGQRSAPDRRAGDLRDSDSPHDHAPLEPRPSSRGDSWDLPPSAVRPIVPAARPQAPQREPALAERSPAGAPPAADEGGATASEAGTRKKRRRRGGSSRSATIATPEAIPERDSAPPPPRVDARTVPRELPRATPAPGPAGASSDKPAPRRRKKLGSKSDIPTASERTGPKSPPSSTSSPKPSASPTPTILKPKRPLYAVHRKLKPSEASAAKRREE